MRIFSICGNTSRLLLSLFAARSPEYAEKVAEPLVPVSGTA